ncbi:hypothetical protein RDWZM_002479 [Blomia tropicalis]|uniref:Uncharacterized protein n=1 Tax=Blomia tropicalis TaxID=40697 RepID=A0A9Q0MDV4_BLOTA|nr:hypothetical protein BLOT_001750 [Blomia tropicalis]KAJ6223934.1 hypothetical protein RDWZM_002479 [Blomia tropicalis]
MSTQYGLSSDVDDNLMSHQSSNYSNDLLFDPQLDCESSTLIEKMTNIQLNQHDSNGNDCSIPSSSRGDINIRDNPTMGMDELRCQRLSPRLSHHVPSWNIDYVLAQLQAKYSIVKQTQNEFHNTFGETLGHYSQFMQHCRLHLATILQEISDDYEQTFKGKMLELSRQTQQLEELMFLIEHKRKMMPSHSVDEQQQESLFDNQIDSDLIKFVQTIMDTQINLPEIRLPPIDSIVLERSFRTMLINILKGNAYASNGNGNWSLQFHPQSQERQLWTMEKLNSDNERVQQQQQQILEGNSAIDSFFTSSSEESHRSCNGAVVINQNFNESGSSSLFGTDSSAVTASIITSSTNGNSTNMVGVHNTAQQNKQILSKSLQPKVRRERMSYVLKFGEQGSLYGQFAEPSGVAVAFPHEDIFIADANNHRVQVFDRWGKFKFHFGDGKLKFPNRIAISNISGEIVVSERPPVHQIQVFDRHGTFQCKFGSRLLRHPRGLAIDHQNRIIVVECKVMRVFIFNLRGELLQSFDCSMSIQFPNAVAVSSKEEIYISDNRNHCVKVFNFDGQLLRQIGGQGITNYPIGVILNEHNNRLLVVDNYNNLNVTIFRLDGQLMNAYESSTKHQQCLDVALFADNQIVVTSKDLQVYIYRLKEANGSRNDNANTNGHIVSRTRIMLSTSQQHPYGKQQPQQQQQQQQQQPPPPPPLSSNTITNKNSNNFSP